MDITQWSEITIHPYKSVARREHYAGLGLTEQEIDRCVGSFYQAQFFDEKNRNFLFVSCGEKNQLIDYFIEALKKQLERFVDYNSNCRVNIVQHSPISNDATDYRLLGEKEDLNDEDFRKVFSAVSQYSSKYVH